LIAGAILLLSVSAFASAQGEVGTAPVSGPTKAAVVRDSGAAQTLLPNGQTLHVDGAGIRLDEMPISTVGRRFASATLTASGRVLIWGGLDGRDAIIATGAWFDPKTEALSEAADVAFPARAGHSITVLTDGRLLMSGGRGSSGSKVEPMLVWDTATPNVISFATHVFRFGATASLRADGKVEIAGGLSAAGTASEDVLEFDEQTGNLTSATARAVSVQSGPSIAGSIPSDGNPTFRADRFIALRFSQLLKPQSLTQRTVTLIGPNGATPVGVVPAENGRLLFVVPQHELLPGARYTLFVANASTKDDELLPLMTLAFGTATKGTSQVAADSDVQQPMPVADAGDNGTASGASGETTQSLPKPPVTLHLSAGSEVVSKALAESCESKELLRGYRFCHSNGEVKGGIFTPGFNNTAARWRLNTPEPDLLSAAGLPAGALHGGVTSLFGSVRRIDDAPVANVTVSIGSLSTRTDAEGRFVLNDVPSGHQVLFVDGSTANHGAFEYGEFLAAADIDPNVANAMPHNMYIPRITARDKVKVPSPTTTETVISHPSVPGLEIHIPPGAVFRDHKGKVITEFAIVPMPVDRSPVPVPENFPVYFSTQPGGATIDGVTATAATGLRVVYPNYVGETKKPSTLWYYDVEQYGWKVYSTAHVSDDGKTFVPESAIGGLHFMPEGGPASGGPDGASGGTCPSSTQPPPSTPIKADPVDCGTGVYFYNQADLELNDISPVRFSRGYNSSDTVQRGFGVGMANNFAMYLNVPGTVCDGNSHVMNYVLVDGNGVQYEFHLFPGSGDSANGIYSAKAYMIHTATPSRFYGALLRHSVGQGHDYGKAFIVVTLTDGTAYWFNVGNGFSCNTTLASIKDRFGNATNLSYSAGLLNYIAFPSGRSLRLGYNGTLISQVTDNSGRSVSYGYNASNRLQTVTYPDTTFEQYTYDSVTSQLKTVQDRNGNIVVTNTYDQTFNSKHRILQQQTPDGTWAFAYTVDSSDKVTATNLTDPRGGTEHIEFDAAGYPVLKTRASGTAIAQTTTFTRGQDELVTSMTDPLGRVTKTTYDGLGNVLTRTYLYGTANAATYVYTYSSDYNQVLTETDPLSHTTTYGYTNGCLTSVNDALNHMTSIACNSAGQPITVTDALGHITRLTYLGYDLRTVSDALNNTTTVTMDSLGRNTVVVDPLGRETRNTYDVNGRISQTVDALNQVTSYIYDNNGNLKSVTDPRTGTTHYFYDARGRQISRSDALNQSENWSYQNGALLNYADRKGQLTQYQFDALNRASLVTYNDASTVTPTFDAGDRLTTVVDSVSGTITRGYDGMDRMTQEQTLQGTVNYTYDAAGRRATMTPASQGQITYTFDNADRLTNIVQGTQSVVIGYDNANRRTSLTLPNGVVATYGYDDANELTSITYKNTSNVVLASMTYTYDAAGQRISQSTTGVGADLLPTANTGTNTFDANNRETVWNGFAIAYDLNGDPTSNASTTPVTTYLFDARHRLTYVRQGTGLGAVTIASYTYDAFNRRTSKTIAGTGAAVSFLYDGENPVQEAKGSTISTILTGLGIDERFARDDASYGRTSFLTDALGSTVALTDSSQTVRQTYSYEPYGEVSTTGASTNPYQYTGRENDGGLYYYRARYYSSGLKRFISEDPMGLSEGLNEYAYVYGNPIRFSDPEGLGLKDKAKDIACAILWIACALPPNQPPNLPDNAPPSDSQPRQPEKKLPPAPKKPPQPKPSPQVCPPEGAPPPKPPVRPLPPVAPIPPSVPLPPSIPWFFIPNPCLLNPTICFPQGPQAV